MSDNSGTISNYGIQTQTSYMMGNTNLRGSNIPQSNDTSLQSVVNSANENIVELNNINIGLSSNLNQEILVKKDELIKLQNEDLTNQLRNLEAIESNIENKNVIIDQINYNMQLQQNNIIILTISILFGIVLLGSIIAYGYGYISNYMFMFIIITLIIFYILYIIYQYNIFYIKSALLAVFNGNLPQRMNESVSDIQNYVINEIEEDIYGNKDQWVKLNCECPSNSQHEETLYTNDSDMQFEENAGYFYYDASSPPQLLLSNPQAPSYLPMSQTPNSSTLENINWVDYDSAKNNYSTNYYNYNNNYTDPSNVLNNELNSANIYVANQTWTNNL